MKTELQRIITSLEVNPIPGRRQLTARILDQLYELQRLKRTTPVVEDKMKCPKCSSEDILTGDPDWAKEFPEVECNSCGECWTPTSANPQKVGNLEIRTVRSIEVPSNPQARKIVAAVRAHIAARAGMGALTDSERDTLTRERDEELRSANYWRKRAMTAEAALQPGEAQGAEPVAWQWRSKLGPSGWKSSSVSNSDPGDMTNQYEKRPLYATPPAAQVTVAEAKRLLMTEAILAALRAVEGEDEKTLRHDSPNKSPIKDEFKG